MELYRWVKASERLPELDNKNPRYYLFRNDVNRNAINIWTEFIRDFPPMITVNKLDWEWLEPIPESEQDELWNELAQAWDDLTGHDMRQRNNSFEKLKQQFGLIKIKK